MTLSLFFLAAVLPNYTDTVSNRCYLTGWTNVLPFQPNSTVAITAPTFVRSDSTNSASATTLTLNAIDATGANYLIIAIGQKNSISRGISSVTNTSSGSTATLIMSTNAVAGTGKIYLYGVTNPVTGTTVVTLTGSATQGFEVAGLMFNNVSTVTNVAGDNSVTVRTSTSCAPASLTTDLVVSVLGYTPATLIVESTRQFDRVVSTNAVNGNLGFFVSTTNGIATATTVYGDATSTGTQLSIIAATLNGK